jgi:hypothetical protein
MRSRPELTYALPVPHATRGFACLMALAAGAACATTAGTIAPQRSASPACAASQRDVRQYLPRLAELDAASLTAAIASYRTATETMLVECGKDARAMGAQFADDWRIQSYFVDRELDRMQRMSPSALTAFLPSHRARVERLLTMYAAMFANPAGAG